VHNRTAAAPVSPAPQENPACGAAPRSAPLHRSAILDQVFAELARRLWDGQSVLIADPVLAANLRLQVSAILDDVLDDVLGVEPAGVSDTQARGRCDVGVSRARRGVHPSESLRAASVLFDVALPVLSRASSGRQSRTGTPTAQLLHHSIMCRVVPAAVGYVDLLLDRVTQSNRDERRRMARELHDRIAHGIGVALQGLELYELDAQRGADTATPRLELTREALIRTLQDVRALAADLRETVVQRRLDTALSDYLALASPPSLRTTVSAAGDLDGLPEHIKEEVFVVVREALRNVLLHASQATLLRVTVRRASHQLAVEVRDDGPGFDLARTPGRSLGLTTMRERIELLGGQITIDGGVGRGTSVEISIPLPRGTV